MSIKTFHVTVTNYKTGEIMEKDVNAPDDISAKTAYVTKLFQIGFLSGGSKFKVTARMKG